MKIYENGDDWGMVQTALFYPHDPFPSGLCDARWPECKTGTLLAQAVPAPRQTSNLG